eukprot:TRINITY_DN10778_c0_g3_i1.p2 TRINITY_DN10778_c0_g3~~TRINITY_DN10778_c0_g3_i1.p2  ORF type:complete len:250 (+),score=72.30 TRINITY_DN10778_c0_g3_i1:52-801(+)
MPKPKPMVAANWKCNGTLESVEKLVRAWNSGSIDHNVDCVVAPPFVHVTLVQRTISKQFQLAVQNCTEKPGAFTGECNIEQVVDVGAQWVILGHSERRTLYGETDHVIGKKVQAVLAKGMGVIACIGERLPEREAGTTMRVVIDQVRAIAASIHQSQWDKVVLAYEPVWAIGTGKVATPEQAQEVHAGIREWLAKDVSGSVAANTRILYGGSVNPKNAQDLYRKPDINGFLVGGASLQPEFLTVINATA